MPDPVSPLPRHIQGRIQWLAHQHRDALRRAHPAWTAQMLGGAARKVAANAAEKLGAYTWSVEAIHAALRARDPVLAREVIVAGTDYDFGLARALILV